MLIRLLGVPRIEDGDAAPAGPRGHKAWALLAYLCLGRRPPGRRHLAELLFAEAEDPLAALRWNLAELRRACRGPDAFTGDPVDPALPPGVSVDVQRLLSAGPGELAELDGCEGELLQGLSFSTSPAFEAWLVPERRRVAMAMEAVLRDRVLLELAAARPERAAALAARLVAANPYDEAHQELVIRSLVAAGDRAAAGERVDACERLFRRELGHDPSRRLRDLVRVAVSPGPRVGGPAAARAHLDAGRAALAAGTVEAGMEFLRSACREAAAAGDEPLHARALLALGGGLVHTTRSHEEGATALHQAAEIALRTGAPGLAATAYREIGFIDVQAGRRERAEVWLAHAGTAAQGDDEELAAIDGVRGMNLSDAARYPEALASLERSMEHGRRCGGRRQLALSASLLARVHLLQGRLERARAMARASLDQAERAQWIAFQPWPETLLAEVALRQGRVPAARARLEHAFTLACHLADSCWEGVSARGLGLLEARTQGRAQARAWLADARARCLRSPAPYQWVHGWILDALAAVPADGDDPDGARWIDALEALAQRAGMRQFLVHAWLYRHRRGDAAALETARLLADDIDNPTLERALAAAE